MDTCVDTYYGDRGTNKCEKCEDPCETCTEEKDKCLSCKLPAPGEPITKFFHDFECKPECPAGWVADEDTRSNVCELCSDNCLTCSGSKDQCTTCKAGMKLDTTDLTCVSSCQKDV